MNSKELIYTLIEKAVLVTSDALTLSQGENTEEVLLLIERRDHIFKIFSETYQKVEKQLDTDYKNQLNQLISQVMEMDKVLIQNLEIQREKVQIDIAKLFKNKENFKKYNLNTLK